MTGLGGARHGPCVSRQAGWQAAPDGQQTGVARRASLPTTEVTGHNQCHITVPKTRCYKQATKKCDGCLVLMC